METIKDILFNLVVVIFYVFQFYTLFLVYYLSIISIFGVLPFDFTKKQKQKEKEIELNAPKYHRFCLVASAHNEEIVIQDLVNSLKNLSYPKDMYDIYVIADNCTDNTAQKAREAGAIVVERENKIERGKGYALKWFFENYLFNSDKKYDAVCVFDADNIVSDNFLLKMNKHLRKGHKVIQAYLDTKNPDDTWITISYALAYWIMNRNWQLAKQKIGLNAAIGGTGFCIETNILKQLGWDALSLTEDLEFTMKCTLNNIKVYWEHEAKIYDEKPLTMKASYRQRVRWLQGHWDCCYKYTVPLFKKFIKEKDILALDAVIYLLQPSRMLLYMVVMGLLSLKLFVPNLPITKFIFPKSVLIVGAFIGYLIPLIALVLENVPFKRFLGIFSYIIFGFTWYPIAFEGWLKRKNKEWTHTKHTRTVKDINNK